MLRILSSSENWTHAMENSSFFYTADINTSVPLVYAGIMFSIIVLGVCLPLNVYVLWLFVTTVRNKVASEFFFLNLCVCEICICSSTFLGVLNITIYKTEINSLFYCFMMFLSIMHYISRPVFQCCVCVERYVAVIYPVIFLKYKPLRYRTALSLVAWIIVVGFSVFCTFLPLRSILYYVLLPEYILAVSIKILCSIAVLKALRKPRPGEKLSKKDAESNRMKKKAFWVIVIILVCTFLTYCPMMMSIFVYDYLSDTQKSICLLAFSYFMILGEFVDPFLYLHRVEKLPFISGLSLCSNYSKYQQH